MTKPVISISICVAAILTSAHLSAQEIHKAASAVRECWLPFPAGLVSVCGQGPGGNGTHRGSYAWDFLLPEGTPIVAPANGRVIRVVDDHTTTGIRPKGNSAADISEYQKSGIANANILALDMGDGTYSWFWHHKAGTARVKPGDFVSAGTHLADVGMSGTYVDHICFSIHSGIGDKFCDVHFRADNGQPVAVKTGQHCRSTTPEENPPPESNHQSMLRGDEFAANGVILQTVRPLFFLTVGEEITYEGKVTQPASNVGFYLWTDGKGSEFIRTAALDAGGHFKLVFRIPSASRGMKCYSITITKPDGSNRSPVHCMVYVL